MNLLRRAAVRLLGPSIQSEAKPTSVIQASHPPREVIREVPVLGRYEGAAHTMDRSWLPGYVQGARQDISSAERLELVRKARYFEKNNAVVQKILDLIETNVVGTGVPPTPSSSDPEWNRKALAWWNQWATEADLCSRQPFAALQAIIVRAQAIDGEVFVHLTQGTWGRPKLQILESHRVMSAAPHRYISEGYVEADGVLFDRHWRPCFYIVSDDAEGRDPAAVSVIPCGRMVHVYEPSRSGQIRGVTLFHSVLHTLHDLDDLQRYEMLAAKDAASRANVVKTETGEVTRDQLGGTSASTGESVAVTEGRRRYYEQAFGGKTVVLRPGEDWKQSESQRPSPAMREFWEYLVQLVCQGVGISFAAVQDYRGDWGGAALRGAVAADNRFYEVRTQALAAALDQIWRTVMGWAIAQGEVPKPPGDWWKVTWQPPRRSTVDVGRESKSIREDLAAGLTTYREALGELGHDWREVLTQRAMEEDFLLELAETYQVPVEKIASLLPRLLPPPTSPPTSPPAAKGVSAAMPREYHRQPKGSDQGGQFAPSGAPASLSIGKAKKALQTGRKVRDRRSNRDVSFNATGLKHISGKHADETRQRLRDLNLAMRTVKNSDWSATGTSKGKGIPHVEYGAAFTEDGRQVYMTVRVNSESGEAYSWHRISRRRFLQKQKAPNQKLRASSTERLGSAFRRDALPGIAAVGTGHAHNHNRHPISRQGESA
jgi:lambda family phage portal protein